MHAQVAVQRSSVHNNEVRDVQRLTYLGDEESSSMCHRVLRWLTSADWWEFGPERYEMELLKGSRGSGWW